jgi:hypothetical protein
MWFNNMQSFNLKEGINMSVKEQINSILDVVDENKATQILIYAQQFRPIIQTDEKFENYGKQVMELIKKKNIPIKAVEVNEKGHIIVNKEKDPDLYDWAVNG